ncbi:uncharacterized protein LOC132311278 isoform X2 [Cornus florida]|uniref:uncharacterized protein LOC132311278 isoform X2 n=1 Tax=Cornus florida TaxID=4283 RepID=UPI0028A046C8|nr:uncharacterized protein LOC132311278 isoform X2 [Cornus florida]
MLTTLCWRHHTLIQSLLSRGPLREDEFHSIFSNVTGKSPDEQSKLGTKYTVPQIAFYKGIIEAIVQDTTARGSLLNLDALNIRLENQALTGTGSQSQGGPSQVPPAFRNFSLSQKEKTLEELVRDQWLCSTPDGNIGLGVRSFLDLRSWFRNNDVPSCEVCNEAGLKAELCHNETCTVRIHKYCLQKKYSQRKVERVCPGCGTQWLIPVSKTEVVEEEDEPNVPSQNGRPPQPSTRKTLRTGKTVDGGDTVGSGSSQASLLNSDTRRTTRSSARLG